MNIKKNMKIYQKLSDLWFIYGNNGRKHTQGNHYLIQRIIEDMQSNTTLTYDRLNSHQCTSFKKDHNTTKECYDIVKNLLKLEK